MHCFNCGGESPNNYKKCETCGFDFSKGNSAGDRYGAVLRDLKKDFEKIGGDQVDDVKPRVDVLQKKEKNKAFIVAFLIAAPFIMIFMALNPMLAMFGFFLVINFLLKKKSNG